MIRKENGQVLIESLFIGQLSILLLLALFYIILTSTQIFIWHQKMNRALLCSLDESQRQICFREFHRHLGREEKFQLRLSQINFQKYRHRPSVEIELRGFFNESYKIRKQISSTQWKI